MFEKCFTTTVAACRRTGWLNACHVSRWGWLDELNRGGSCECVSIDETNLGKVSLRILIVAKCWTFCLYVCLLALPG